MPILGISLFFGGESLRLSSPFGVSILGIGISSRLVRSRARPKFQWEFKAAVQEDGKARKALGKVGRPMSNATGE
eukprot:3381439-Pyramimonas_sp.AAC.1